MPARDQARRAYQQVGDYRSAGTELGVPTGQAYPVATGQPADGSDAPPPETAVPACSSEARSTWSTTARSQLIPQPGTQFSTGSGSGPRPIPRCRPLPGQRTRRLASRRRAGSRLQSGRTHAWPGRRT
jgi:hypothetical protein